MPPIKRKIFPLRVGNALVCEDVRPELGGKHSLLGVYSGDILVPEFKNFLRATIYIELFALKLGTIRLEVVISYDDKEIIKLIAEFDFRDTRDPALIVSPTFPIPLTGAGLIIVNAICEGQEKRLLSKQIRMRDAMLAAASPSA